MSFKVSIPLLITSYLLLTFLNDEYILSSEYLNHRLEVELNPFEANNLILLKDRFFWTSYIFKLLSFLSKIFYISICFNVGALIYDKKISFKEIVNIVLTSEFVFIFSGVINFITLYPDLFDLSLEYVISFYSFSLLSLIGIDSVNSDWVIYSLQNINLYQVLYIIIIAYLFSKKMKYDFFESLNFVLPNYLTALLIWLTSVSFITFLFTQ